MTEFERTVEEPDFKRMDDGDVNTFITKVFQPKKERNLLELRGSPAEFRALERKALFGPQAKVKGRPSVMTAKEIQTAMAEEVMDKVHASTNSQGSSPSDKFLEVVRPRVCTSIFSKTSSRRELWNDSEFWLCGVANRRAGILGRDEYTPDCRKYTTAMEWTPGSSSTPCFSIRAPDFGATRKPKILIRDCIDDPWGQGKAGIFRMETKLETTRRLTKPEQGAFFSSRHSLWQAEEVPDTQSEEPLSPAFSTKSFSPNTSTTLKSPTQNSEVNMNSGKRLSRELMPIEVIQAQAAQPVAKPTKLRITKGTRVTKAAPKMREFEFGESPRKWNLEQPSKTYSRCKDGVPKVTWLNAGNEHVSIGPRRQRAQADWRSFSTPESLILGRPRRSASSTM